MQTRNKLNVVGAWLVVAFALLAGIPVMADTNITALQDSINSNFAIAVTVSIAIAGFFIGLRLLKRAAR